LRTLNSVCDQVPTLRNVRTVLIDDISFFALFIAFILFSSFEFVEQVACLSLLFDIRYICLDEFNALEPHMH